MLPEPPVPLVPPVVTFVVFCVFVLEAVDVALPVITVPPLPAVFPPVLELEVVVELMNPVLVTFTVRGPLQPVHGGETGA